MARTIDPQSVVGRKFCRIIVLEFVGFIYRGRMGFLCRCDCGKEWNVPYQVLRRGSTKSCGCLSRERTISRNTTHGMSGSPEHETWKGMIRRCYNKNNDDYSYYGGRGITVCDRWRYSFAKFYEDMGPRPSSRFTMIERIDNMRGYEQGNCKWAEYKEQARNRRNNRIIEYEGRQWVFVALCEHFGRSEKLVRNRLRYGWTLRDAIETPPGLFYRYNGRVLR